MVVTTTSVTVAPGGRVRKLYKCSSCSKVFQRSEHCIRHERSHTQERPFACYFCHKMYARKDLVKRHEKTIHAEQYEALQAASTEAEQRSLQHKENATDPDAPDGLDIVSMTPSRHPDAASVNSANDNNHSLLGDNGALDRDTQQSHEIAIDPELYRQIGDFPTSTEQVGGQFPYSLPSPLATDGTDQTDQLQDISSAGRDAFHVEGFDFLADMAVDHDQQGSNKRRRLDTTSTQGISTMPPSTINAQIHALQTLSEPFDFSLLADIFSLDETYPMPNLSCTPPSSDGTSPEQHMMFAHGIYDTTNDTARNHNNPSLEQSRRLFRQLPHVLQEKSNSPPRFEIDQGTYQSICNDITSRLGGEECQNNTPTIQELRRFLVGYFDCFHRHLPIIHIPSLVLSETPSPLVLALSCIGALYRLDRRRADLMYQLSLKLLQKFEIECYPTQATTPLALWAIQTRVLLSIFALFTGNAALITAEFQRLGFYLTDYRLRRTLIAKTLVPVDQMTWNEYVQRESHKRVLCAINIKSNLAMVVYDVTPGFVNPVDLDFEMPDEEHLWNAKTEEEWRRLWISHKQPSRSLRNVLTDIISGDHNDTGLIGDQSYQLTSFGGLVLMHAVCIHMWTSLQFTRAVGLYSNIGIVGNVNLRAIILATGISTLSRCQKSLLRDDRDGKPVEPPWYVSEGPLLFNSQAVLRIACTRLFLPEVPFQRIVMITGTEDDMNEAASAYVASPLERSDLNTKAAAKASQGFLTPVQIGHLLVRKTAAFAWSIEHAVAGWDSALFLTKWIHTIEIESSIIPVTAEEQAILSDLKASLSEIDCPYQEHTSLASAVARAWARFLTDVWVWGVTPKMGFALERLATYYQKEFDRLFSDK